MSPQNDLVGVDLIPQGIPDTTSPLLYVYLDLERLSYVSKCLVLSLILALNVSATKTL